MKLAESLQFLIPEDSLKISLNKYNSVFKSFYIEKMRNKV